MKFFREFYRIPKNVKIWWCVLVERYEETENLRLGVSLIGQNKVIDVAARQFVQTNLPTAVSYAAYPAQRKTEGDEVVFTAEGEYSVRVPKTYVTDIYYRSVYSDELVLDTLL